MRVLITGHLGYIRSVMGPMVEGAGTRSWGSIVAISMLDDPAFGIEWPRLVETIADRDLAWDDFEAGAGIG